MKDPENPFIINTYHSPEYFCNRTNETERLISAIKNGRNITLFSIRRLGKTSLIQHVFHNLNQNSDYLLVYSDMLPTSNISEFVSVLAKAVLQAESSNQSTLKKLMASLSKLRPTISSDALTGNPEFSVNVGNDSDAVSSIEILLSYLDNHAKIVICAIDEFQQITNYPEKNMEARLRTSIQLLKKTRFIFSGSSKTILSEIFTHPKRPFFNSTEIMELKGIDPIEYRAFIKKHFVNKKKQISDEALTQIQNVTEFHTFYVQYMCNKLYQKAKKTIEKEEINNVYLQILEENQAVYSTYLQLLTPFQFKLLRAIASDSPILAITGSSFLSKHSLGSPSSVNRASTSLLSKELIYIEADGYRLQDKFFSGWLKRTKV
ncbi:MAG: ATP-binding protein [Bacteroidetes bacterium]|nr:ATP-binding protein [Bacteroidota bacterium]